MVYGGDPANSNNDAVRALLGDTSTSTALLSDSEVSWLVASHPNVYYTAAVGADMLFANNATSVTSKKVGDLSLVLGGGAGGATNYKQLGEELRLTAARMGVKGYAGGISVSDKDTQIGDTDWDRSEIELGMHDYDTASNSTSGVMNF